VGHGFLRVSNGTFTTFDAPGAAAGMIGTFPASINPAEAITGLHGPEGGDHGNLLSTHFGKSFRGNFRVFVRTPDGAFTTFDAATYPPCCIWSFPSGINPAEAITGSYSDGFTINHGFLPHLLASCPFISARTYSLS